MKTNQSPCSHCAGTEFRITTDPKTELATGECRACGMLTLYRLPPIARRKPAGKAMAVALAAAIAILAATPFSVAAQLSPAAAQAESITTQLFDAAAIESDRRRKPATRRSSTMLAGTRPDHRRTSAAGRISMMRAAI